MEVLLDLKQKTAKDIKYLVAQFVPRYFEDAEYFDTESNKFMKEPEDPKESHIFGIKFVKDGGEVPDCVTKYDEAYVDWTIDVEKGQIMGWNGPAMSIYYKVCDQGVYGVLDSQNNEIFKVESYVPKILCIGNEGFGDYMYLDINEEGYIKGWRCDSKLIQDLFNGGF